MTSAETFVPVYPTWAQFWRVPARGAAWRDWYPFNADGGTWTFSGRVALHHGLPALGLSAGSTILVPSYHQGVEIDTLLAAGHRLRYYRVNPDLTLDVADLERRLDDAVSAVYVTHYFGFTQPLAAVRRLCEERRLKLIEDCALSLFSRDGDTWAGSIGDLALFSVYKTLPLPHGGFLVTRPAAPRDRLRPAPLLSTLVQAQDLLHLGLRSSRWRPVESALATAVRSLKSVSGWDRGRTINSGGALWDGRMLGHGASAGSVWLMRFMDPGEVIARRRANYERLAARLRGHVRVPFPELPDGACPLFLPVMVPGKVQVQEQLAARGVSSVDLWDASHPTCPADLAEEIAGWRRECLELPIHQELGPADVDRVGDAVLAVLGRVH